METFYKTVKNRIDYIDGADLIANEAIEQVILNGEMRSYGLEVYVEEKILENLRDGFPTHFHDQNKERREEQQLKPE